MELIPSPRIKNRIGQRSERLIVIAFAGIRAGTKGWPLNKAFN